MAREGQLAREVRTGLESETVSMNGASRSAASLSVVSNSGISKKSKQPVALLDQLYFGKPKRDHVKEFGCLFGAIFSGIAAYWLYHGHTETPLTLLGLTIVFVAAGAKAPILLYPIWSAWMAFAHGLGVVMSFVFITITWFAMAVPLGILLKIIGKKVMDLSFDRSVESYWEEREEKLHNFKLLERQF